ncbi:hypothetical protein ROZALSC1DRAFT_26263, partial [Rozella allomycis CSF55]
MCTDILNKREMRNRFISFLNLLEQKNICQENIDFSFQFACQFGFTEIVEIMIYCGNTSFVKSIPSVEPKHFSKDKYAFINASDEAHNESIKHLLTESTVDFSERLCEINRRTMVKILLENLRVDPSANDNYAVRTAA